MKQDKISDTKRRIDDDIVSVQEYRKKNKGHKKSWMKRTAIGACICLLAAAIGFGGNKLFIDMTGSNNDNNINDKVNNDTEHLISKAVYPEMSPYPDEMSFVNYDDFTAAYNAWNIDRQARLKYSVKITDGLKEFFDKTVEEFLTEEDGKNKVYSPLNVYMALSMLAEVTDTESRQQILELLGAEDIEELRMQVNSLWNSNYCDDKAVTSILANSFWLSENINYNQPVMDILSENYYASSYRGEMGSEDYNKVLQGWLNEQTGGLLEEQVKDVGFDSQTIMALASAIYFQAKWVDSFSENATKEGIFHSWGGDLTCDFMNQSVSDSYYWGDDYTAVAKKLEGSGSMWLILPDEGVSPEAVIQSGEVMDLIMNNDDLENKKFLQINLSMPKFDVTSDTDLKEGLSKLGIIDVFDSSVSDFSPITSEVKGISLSKVEHTARVMADEEGCTATAYTVMMADGAVMPPEEEVDLVLDRPFVFAITSDTGMPLFMGAVNQP